MTRAYKITRLPDGYCKVAVAAWKALGDRELFEIEGRLVFTDDLESYMECGDRTAFCADEFDSHAAFEKWRAERGGRVVPERPPDGRQPRPVPLTRLTMALWQEPKPPQGVAGATASK